MHSQLLHPFHHPFSHRVILTGSLSKLTLDFANFTGVAGSEFAMLDVSRTLLRIVARLPKTEYSEDKSNGPIRRQAAEDQLDDLPDPASDGDTSQG